VIITNAERGWVQLSAKMWMPKVAEVINGFLIVSARTEYESMTCQHPIAWKARAFADVTKDHLAIHGDVRTLMSLGDSAAERQAALQVWPPMVNDRTVHLKSIKLPERPSIATLDHAHAMLTPMLETLVDHEGHLDLVLNPEAPRVSAVAPGTQERCLAI
jgi:hypothetical protein